MENWLPGKFEPLIFTIRERRLEPGDSTFVEVKTYHDGCKYNHEVIKKGANNRKLLGVMNYDEATRAIKKVNEIYLKSTPGAIAVTTHTEALA